MIGDFTNFFDNLDHLYLKQQLCQLLGVCQLPDDYYAVYKSVTKYCKWDLNGIAAAANLRLFIPAFFLPRPPPKAAHRIPHAALNHNQIPCTAPFSAKFSCKVSHRQL